uniref:Uncharacterized protein n=1 Tax=Ciona intestinalis TaxID=7719 RepID=H2XSA7_CIOIN
VIVGWANVAVILKLVRLLFHILRIASDALYNFGCFGAVFIIWGYFHAHLGSSVEHRNRTALVTVRALLTSKLIVGQNAVLFTRKKKTLPVWAISREFGAKFYFVLWLTGYN